MSRAIAIFAAVLAGLLAGCSAPAQDQQQATEAGPSRAELLAARQALRLYDGAPPVIPHRVESLGRENCANCHEPGALDNPDRIAPPRTHPAWGDCRQCHVERKTTKVFVNNEVTPLWWPARGARQTPISPPLIPHHIQNRENCALCHIGAQAPAALRAAHGYRPECRQCHVPMHQTPAALAGD